MGLHNLQGDKNIQEYHPNSRKTEAEFPKVGFLKPNKSFTGRMTKPLIGA